MSNTDELHLLLMGLKDTKIDFPQCENHITSNILLQSDSFGIACIQLILL